MGENMAAPDPDLGDGWRYRVARENGSVSSKSWPLICPSILSTKSYVKPDIGGGGAWATTYPPTTTTELRGIYGLSMDIGRTVLGMTAE